MKFPMMNRQATRTVTVPKLSGGVNMRDSVTLINDNQLTECKNVWYKDGSLKTRPGLDTNENMWISTPCHNDRCNGKPLDIYMKKDRRLYRLYQFEVSGVQNGVEYQTFVSYNGVAWISGNDVITLPLIEENISFVTQFDDKIYVYCVKGASYDFDTDTYKPQEYIIYSMQINLESDEYEWIKIEELPDNENDKNYIYIPLIATNCKTYGADSLEKELEYNGNYGGIMFEGYNILSPYYRMIYSSVNKELLDSTNLASTHHMKYELINRFNKSDCVGKKIVVYKTMASGQKVRHEITLDGSDGQIESTQGSDGYYLATSGGKYVGFMTSATSGWATTYALDYIENDLEIIAPYSNSNEKDKVFCMTQNIWFGGDASSISGGTRLFLGGNTTEKEKSLVLWSDLNRPTYFPENNYAYVGNHTQRVNAFGKQNESLIIFKDREIFYTSYNQNSGITAEDLINQMVVDYSASSTFFPMIQLHSGIGCDCPETVQLCRNRLVWANSDGNVYTLMTQNQFSERNVYCVSDMISRSLKENGLENAYAADFDGHYFLFVNGNVYVMDYNSYGYISISSYNKSEDAQINIPWWKWEVPYKFSVLGEEYTDSAVKGACAIGNELYCIFYDGDGLMSGFYVCGFIDGRDFDLLKNGISQKPIESHITTKIFDFGAPHKVKNIALANINFGDSEDKVDVTFVSDKGTDCKRNISVYENSRGEYSADYVHNRQFRPHNQFVNRMGVRIECKGKMSIDSISIDYKILGGAK